MSSEPLDQGYVDAMLTPEDQERLRSGAVKGLSFGNRSNVIVWEDGHFAELSMDDYQRRRREEDQ